ncbi:MAG: hypothetical protein K0S28_1706, partial [Paucimonas sp.]|nr:hypothetical protein [Paucimonas sp.]
RGPAVKKQPQKERDNLLERIAKTIDPPGQENTDDELKDLGTMTPEANDTDNRS